MLSTNLRHRRKTRITYAIFRTQVVAYEIHATNKQSKRIRHVLPCGAYLKRDAFSKRVDKKAGAHAVVPSLQRVGL